MRIKTLAGGAILALGMLSAGGAFAAQSNADALSGAMGATTCGDFTKMDTTAQADFVSKVNTSGANSSSLTSNSGQGNTMADTSASTGGSTAGALGLGSPLDAGQLIAACQAASPTTSLQNAFSAFSSTNTPAANTGK